MDRKKTLLTDYFGELHDARSLQSRDGVAFFGDLPDVCAIDAWSSDGGALKDPAGAVGAATEQAQTESGRGDLDDWMADWEMRFAQRKLEREAARRERSLAAERTKALAAERTRARLQERAPQVIALLESGKTVTEVALELGENVGVVRSILQAAGVSVRSIAMERTRARYRERALQVIALLESGKTVAEVALEVGENVGVVNSIMQVAGISACAIAMERRKARRQEHDRARAMAAEQKKVRRQERVGKMLAMLEAGKTMAETAHEVGLSYMYACRVLIDNGIDFRSIMAERKRARRQQRARDVLAMLEAGKTKADIAREIGISQGYVNQILRDEGVDLRTKRKKVRQERAREVLAMLESGKTLADVAREMGTSYGSVRKILIDGGVDARAMVAERRKERRQERDREVIARAMAAEQKRACRQQRAREVLAMLEAGKTQADVAREIGISQGYVSQILRNEGVDLRAKRKEVRQQRAREVLAMLEAGKTQVDIAREMGISHQRVSQILRDGGVDFCAKRKKSRQERAREVQMEADLEIQRRHRAAERAKQTSEIIARIAAGYACDQVARDLGLDRRAIEYKLRSIGRAKTRATDPEHEELQARQQEAVRSVVRAARAGEAAKIEDVARALGASVQAVRTWLQAG